MEFKHLSKIPRISHETWIATEKIDGTNGVIAIDENNNIFVGSRNKWLTLEDDNYGFCAFVNKHREDILQLGPGYHYGEWYGSGIQRGYELQEKRLALFYKSKNAILPSCCQLVPWLAQHQDLRTCIDNAILKLGLEGSALVPGYHTPEGIVIQSKQSGQRYKIIFD